VLVTGGTSGIGADIAGAVLFLSSAAGSWMTGQTIVVDGGYSVVG
jgi:NAD(P)-dependent dehydrogenase (short-subunit alcohol dehydrogenase family)